MKAVTAFQADDGTLFDSHAQCAAHDLTIALGHFRSAVMVDALVHASVVAPREALRKAIDRAYGRLRTVKECLVDLDHYDDDPTDPERIRAAQELAARDKKRAEKDASATCESQDGSDVAKGQSND